MKILNALLNLVVVAFAVFVALLLATVLNENTIFNIQNQEQVLILYKAISGVGAGLVLLKILVSHLYIADLRHENHMAQLKINDLKVDLYEKRQEFRSNSFRTMLTQEEMHPAAAAG